MFERFSTGARTTVLVAREQAVALGDDHIGTEHVLVALAQDAGIAGQVLREAGVSADAVLEDLRTTAAPAGDDLDADALRRIGIDLDDVRRSVEETFGPGALDDTPPSTSARRRRWFGGDHVPFTPRAKKLMEHALRQVAALRAPAIGAEHLLLGLLDAGEGRGTRLLTDRGVDLASLRTAVVQRTRDTA
jgi:ATP-dependent Clp protease ATP-binding subunit ClpA